MLHISILQLLKDFAGRHRWVEYADKGRYNASQVPPEWHGWLQYITDSTGDEASSLIKTMTHAVGKNNY